MMDLLLPTPTESLIIRVLSHKMFDQAHALKQKTLTQPPHPHRKCDQSHSLPHQILPNPASQNKRKKTRPTPPAPTVHRCERIHRLSLLSSVHFIGEIDCTPLCFSDRTLSIVLPKQSCPYSLCMLKRRQLSQRVQATTILWLQLQTAANNQTNERTNEQTNKSKK